MVDTVLEAARLHREGKTIEARALLEEYLKMTPTDRAAVALLDDIVRESVRSEASREHARTKAIPATFRLFSPAGCLVVLFLGVSILAGLGVALFPRLLDFFFNCIVRGFLGDGSGCGR